MNVVYENVTLLRPTNSIGADFWRAVSVTEPRETGADPGVEIGGGHMASAEREPIMGVWGLCPSGVQGRAPGQGVRGAMPPEAERFLVLSYV